MLYTVKSELTNANETEKASRVEARATAVVKEITTSKGKFPVIDLPNRSQSDAINSYIVKEVFGKNYATADVKSMIENTGWDKDNYANYTSVEYHIKTNTSSQLILDIASCVAGASEHCAIVEFTFNPITGSKTARLVAHN